MVTNRPGWKLGVPRDRARRRGGAAAQAAPASTQSGALAPRVLATRTPCELAVHVAGHDLTSASALWNCVDVGRPLAVPGAIALAGWPALP